MLLKALTLTEYLVNLFNPVIVYFDVVHPLTDADLVLFIELLPGEFSCHITVKPRSSPFHLSLGGA